MRGKEPIDVFLTENKNTDADTRGCHMYGVTDTSSVNSVARASGDNRGAGSLTTGGWWCALKEREQQYETGVSYPTEVVVVNSNRPRILYTNLLVSILNQQLANTNSRHRGISTVGSRLEPGYDK